MQDGEHGEDVALADWMKHVFARMVAGQTADQAFGLVLARGKYTRDTEPDRKLAIAALVVMKIRHGKDPGTGNALTLENAVLDVSEEVKVGERTVERHYQKFGKGLHGLPDETLRICISQELPPP